MPDRRVAPWLAGLVALAVICAGAAVAMGAASARMFTEADQFYRDQTATTEQPEAVYRYYDMLLSTSFTLQSIQAAVLSGSVLSLVALIAVLALRWERRMGARL